MQVSLLSTGWLNRATEEGRTSISAYLCSIPIMQAVPGSGILKNYRADMLPAAPKQMQSKKFAQFRGAARPYAIDPDLLILPFFSPEKATLRMKWHITRQVMPITRWYADS
jgi:hypothetical protein